MILNDELVLEAKRRAAERRSNVSAIVNEALMVAFRPAPNPETPLPFQMPTFRPAGGQPVNTSPTEFAELLVAEEMEPYES
ncbi:MAG: hypothetical protein K9M97_07560 [Akkermansiaceae bacterium]|nr:hypothetical protein [Akkermansiaceae bacterium]